MIAPPPPSVLDLPYGTRLVAGLGYSTVLADFDFETYSEAGFEYDHAAQRWRQPKGATGTKTGLPLVGAAVYAQHPSTEVLSLAYNLKDGRGNHWWRPGMPPPLDLFQHLANGKLLEAWNVSFERWIWTEVCVPKYGWPPIPDVRLLRCAMAKSRAFGLPGALGMAAQVTGAATQKDKDGTRLLNKFSRPRNPTKADPRLRLRPEDDPVDGPKLYGYNISDIEAEASVSALCPDLEGEELEFWFCDQAINTRGVKIDRAGSEACAAIVEAALERYNAELCTLTGGAVTKASEVQGLREWLEAQGCFTPSLDEDAVTSALARPTLLPQARRALEIRQAVGSASVKKVFAMLHTMARGDRVHDLFVYHGARTGRPTGGGVQPTNMPKAGPEVVRCGHDGRTAFERGCGHYHAASLAQCPWCGTLGPPGRKAEWSPAATEDALTVMATRSLALVEAMFGDAMLTVSGCMRAMFIGETNLVASDYSAIEAVVIAMLSGEQWRIDVFRKKTDVYLESISRSQGVPIAELLAHKTITGAHHPLRQSGKIRELALGFGGWIGALRSMADSMGIEISPNDDDLKRDIVAWRKASPAVVELWGGQSRDFGRVPGMFGLEGASIQAMLHPGVRQFVMRLDGTFTGLSYLHQGTVLYLTLPSGRHIAYQNPRLSATGTWRGYRLQFETWNTNPTKGPVGWIDADLYGGLDSENATQAVARDIQRHAIVNLEAQGHPVVLHVYDEDVSETEADVATIERIMSTMPSWAADWPVSANGGWSGKRYRKE